MDVLNQGLAVAARLCREVLDPLKKSFVGKDEIVDLMGISLVAGENLFLLGPPGTAKSALVRELGRRLEGPTFEYLLTRFTEPSELFGPFDIRRLREGDLVTNTEGMLPEASLIFLDELLNANSAILNSLLLVLNERLFRRGRETRALPALMVVGASNHLPEDETLGALFDRFLMRVRCDNVPEDHLAQVLDAGWRLDLGIEPASATLRMDDLRGLKSLLPRVDLAAVRPALVDLVVRLRRAGFAVSDRRAVKLQRLVAASAILAGRQQCRVSDLWIFRYIWDRLDQVTVLAEMVERAVAQGPAEPGDHPRSRPTEAPDPEELARDIDLLAQRIEAAPSAAEKARLKDRLTLLAQRAQWIRDPTMKTQIDERLGNLWNRSSLDS